MSEGDVLSNILTTAFLATWLSAALRLAGPLLMTSLGEIIAERSGMLNVAIEGLMGVGALTGFLVAFYSDSLWLGMLGAVFVCLLCGLFLAWMYITVSANMAIVGILFNILALGATSYAYRAFFGTAGVRKSPVFDPVAIPWLSDIPLIGPVLFSQGLLFYVTISLVFVVGYVLYRTQFGLELRASGDGESAARTSGINVTRIRYIGILVSSTFAGAGGAYLMLGSLGLFRDNIVNGRGFIALSIVIFGRWNPYRATVAALVFGAADALQLSLQASGVAVPSEILLALPYVMTIVAMSGLLGSANPPRALMEFLQK